MKYRCKSQVFDALKPRYASCQVYYEMDKVSPQVKNKVITSLERGYHTTRAGEAGILYDAVCREFEVPRTRLLKTKRDNWKFTTYLEDDVLYEKLIEFSKADCTAHLIELSARPVRVTSWGEYNDAEEFRNFMKRQDSGVAVWKYSNEYYYEGKLSMRINCLKDMKLLREILEYPKSLGVYNERAQEAIALLRSNGSLVIEYKPN